MNKLVPKTLAWLSFAFCLVSVVIFIIALVQAPQDPVTLGGLAVAAVFLSCGLSFNSIASNPAPETQSARDPSLRQRRLRALTVAMVPLGLAMVFRAWFLLLVAVPLAGWAWLRPESVEKLFASVKAKLTSRKQS